MFRMTVKVNPGASRQRMEWRGDHMKVNVTSPPEDGRANEELVSILAELFEIPEHQVSIDSGRTARQKDIILHNLGRDKLIESIDNLGSGD
ncbi:MAG: DUF167 domain-containing protein [bacterium]